MNFEAPEKNAGTIVFLVFVLLMLAVMLLSKQFRDYVTVGYKHNTNNLLATIAEKKLSEDDYSLACSMGDMVPKVSVESRLARSMASQLIMCRQKNDGKIIYHKFCREGSVSCPENMEKYAKYIVKYATEFKVDPWLVAAVAMHETNFDAFVVGGKGERGIFQLLPYSPWGKQSIFVQSAKYRESCKKVPGHCQEIVTGLAVKVLKASFMACKTETGALSMYNSGGCNVVNRKYIDGVKKNKAVLKREYVHVKWCSGESIR